jgi:hypothetical protein
MFLHNRALRLKAALLHEPSVAVINLPTIPTEETLLQRSARHHVAVVPVASLHAGTLEAIALAKLLQPDEIRAVHFLDDEANPDDLLRRWEEMALDVPLQIVAAPYRQIDRPLVTAVRDIRSDGADLVTVVMGELILRWWHHLLHNHRTLEVKAALLFEPGVAVAVVPHHL